MTNEIIRCKDCKWWHIKPQECIREKAIEADMEDRIKFLNEDYFLAPWEGEMVHKKTGANFGCVHGEKKEENING